MVTRASLFALAFGFLESVFLQIDSIKAASLISLLQARCIQDRREVGAGRAITLVLEVLGNASR
jgi:hypothetical protein